MPGNRTETPDDGFIDEFGCPVLPEEHVEFRVTPNGFLDQQFRAPGVWMNHDYQLPETVERPINPVWEFQITQRETPREALIRVTGQIARATADEQEAMGNRFNDGFRGLRLLGGGPPPAWNFPLELPRPVQRANVFAADQRIQAAFNDGFWHRQLTARPRQVPVSTPEVVAARDILRPFGVDDVAVGADVVPEPLTNRIAPSTTRAMENYVLRRLGSELTWVGEIDGRRRPLEPSQWVDPYITAEVHRPPAGDIRIRVPRTRYAHLVEDIPIPGAVYPQLGFSYLGAAEPHPIEVPMIPWPDIMRTQQVWERAYEQSREQIAQKSRERAAAERKAEELLLSHLDDAQLKIWKVSRCFYVRSQHDHTYRVRGGFHGSVERLHPVTKAVMHRYCIVPSSGWWPTGDILVSKLMLLKYDEDTFLRVANPIDLLG